MEIKQLFAVLLALVMVSSFIPAAIAQSGSDDTQTTQGTVACTVDADCATGEECDDGFCKLHSSSDTLPSREDNIRERADLRNDFKGTRDATREEFKAKEDALKAEREKAREDFKNNWGNETNLTKEQREQRREEFKDARETAREAQKKMLDDFKQRREQVREEFKGRIEQLREDMKKANEHQKELREQFKSQREDLEKSREDFKKECRDNNSTNSTVCKHAKEELQQGRKNVLDNAGKQVLEALSVMKTRVQTNPNLEATTSSALLDRLTTSETAVTAAQAKIIALTNQSTVNETKAAADALKVALDDARVSLKLAHGALVNADFQKFLTHVSTMSEKFKAKSVELKAAGKDTTKLDAAISDFDAKIASVSATFKQAQDSFVTAMASAKTESDVNAILKAERDQLVAAKADAEKAREDLKTIVKELRALDPNAVAAVAKEVSDESKATESTDVDAGVSA